MTKLQKAYDRYTSEPQFQRKDWVRLWQDYSFNGNDVIKREEVGIVVEQMVGTTFVLFDHNDKILCFPIPSWLLEKIDDIRTP